MKNIINTKNIAIFIILTLFLPLKSEQKVFLYWQNQYSSIALPFALRNVSLYWWRPISYTNFGDELSPKIVERIIGHPLKQNQSKQQFLALGSILHNANNNAVVWGSGVNGKIPLSAHTFSRLDVRAVRGPLTRDFLLSKGIDCPKVYGDPALLMPLLFPELKADPQKEYIVIPHINEMGTVNGYPNVVRPTEDCMTVVKKILQAKFVISSSVHGVSVA